MIITVRSEERERGAAALSLLVMAMIISLTIVLYMALPLATASDRKSANRTAADAAALAGAEFVRTDLENLLADKGWLGSFSDYTPFLDLGGSAAQTYAARNGGTLVAYDFDVIGWKAHAKVESPEIRKGSDKPVSEATAQLDFPDCLSKPSDDPTTEPPPADDDPPKPPKVEIHCGDLDIKVVPVKDGDSWRYELPGWAIPALLNLVSAKLID